jgi:hypothetical protein
MVEQCRCNVPLLHVLGRDPHSFIASRALTPNIYSPSTFRIPDNVPRTNTGLCAVLTGRLRANDAIKHDLSGTYTKYGCRLTSKP